MTEGNGEVRESPKGWCWVQHKDIAEINPKLPSNDLPNDLLVSFVPMAAVEEKSGRYSLSQIREYEKVKKGYTPFINGDLIFAKITPCMENGKVAIVDNLENSIGFGSTEFHVSRLTSYTNRKYLFYYFVQEAFRRDARRHMSGSAGQLRVPKSYFEETRIPLAPLLEQERIIERIEELFSDLDQGIETLKTARKQLKVYRQAVLKWAFEGKLTEQWRYANLQKSDLKTGEELLAQIKVERENRYQQQLAEWEEKIREWESFSAERNSEGTAPKSAKKPTKPSKPKDLPPLTKAELAELPELPDRWCWARVDQLGDVQLGRQRSPQNRSQDFPTLYIRAANITENGLNLTDVLDMEFKPHEFKQYQLKCGDIVLSEASGSPDQVGKPAMWRDQIANCCFQNTVVRFKPIYLSSEYFLVIFKNLYVNGVFSNTSSGVGIDHLSANKFSAILIPVAPKEEQEEIVQDIESRLSICDQLESTIIENLQKAEALRQSILKQAFEGKLVPQDPNDEPAEKLLERIKAERQEQRSPKASNQLKIKGV